MAISSYIVIWYTVALDGSIEKETPLGVCLRELLVCYEYLRPCLAGYLSVVTYNVKEVLWHWQASRQASDGNKLDS